MVLNLNAVATSLPSACARPALRRHGALEHADRRRRGTRADREALLRRPREARALRGGRRGRRRLPLRPPRRARPRRGRGAATGGSGVRRGKLLREPRRRRGPPAKGPCLYRLLPRGAARLRGHGHHGTAAVPVRPPRVPLQRRRVAGGRLRAPLRVPVLLPRQRRRRAREGRRDTELHFLEACFCRRPDGSAATARRGAGRSGDAFYRCCARDERHGGRDVFPCRFRVTDERGRTTVAVTCAKAGDGEDPSVSARPDAGLGHEAAGPPTSYAIMDDLVVKPIEAGLSGSAMLPALGVAADTDDVREETVPFGYKEGLGLLLASLRSKTALTDVFLPALARATRRRRQ
ncbi:uncharacterized protein LOC112892823 [Panicum hallii]|uniref:uncharacterized protein LOC112892823 n=1 Tax=Panicum hallii TaxID=206008 RepID=UPI000DF4D15B|nr:uncharacterized protein LOC112892823 [Panicum hallii]